MEVTLIRADDASGSDESPMEWAQERHRHVWNSFQGVGVNLK